MWQNHAGRLHHQGRSDVTCGKTIPAGSIIRVDQMRDTAGASEATVQSCQTIRRQIAQDVLSSFCDIHSSSTFVLSDPPTHHVCRATDHIAVILVICRWNHAVSVLTFVNRWHFHVCLFESAPLRGVLWTRHSATFP